MSIQIALDSETNDIIKLEGGGIARVCDGRYVVQLVKNKLLTALGEWSLNPSIGWINIDDFVKNPDLFNLEMRAKEVILSVPSVATIDSFNMSLSKRVLTVTFTATTTFGSIDLTVPWSVSQWA